MRIGLVYDLKDDYLALGYTPADVMEMDDEGVVAGLEGALRELGHVTDRVGRGVVLARRLAAGDRWDLVLSIAEGIEGRSREAQVPALCELFGQPYLFSDPLTCALTLDKAMAKRVVRDHGLPTAPFAVVERPEQADAVRLETPLFVKPVAEGSSKGVTGRSLVRHRDDLGPVCAELIRLHRQPVLVERFLPGREVTVGVVGNGVADVVGVMEVVFTAEAETAAYTALNKEEYLDRVRYRLAEGAVAAEAGLVAVAVYTALGCRDTARIDLRADEDGVFNFIEANPLPGLHPVRSDLPIMARLAGVTYRDLIGRIVASASSRTVAAPVPLLRGTGGVLEAGR